MDLTGIFDAIGEPATIALGALLIGVIFGAAAQRSRFCLRSAVTDILGTGDRATRDRRLWVWLLGFGAAIATTQLLIAGGLLDVSNVRQLTSARSISGVLIGGLVFGIGMTLTRGCVSRLTVLSANGNLRAAYCLAIFAGVAYATFDGPLTPLRQSILGLWTVGPDTGLNLIEAQGLGPLAGAGIGGLLVALALAGVRVLRLGAGHLVGGLVVGVTIALGWWFTWTLSGQVFEPVVVESISFTRPAIDLVDLGAAGFPLEGLGFGIGILAGVLAGSFAAGLLTRELQLQWFDSLRGAARYTAGATLMGFGGVLAGGCSVGAGMTGGSLFALAPLVALGAMVAGSALTTWALAQGAAPVARSTAGPVAAE